MIGYSYDDDDGTVLIVTLGKSETYKETIKEKCMMMTTVLYSYHSCSYRIELLLHNLV